MFFAQVDQIRAHRPIDATFVTDSGIEISQDCEVGDESRTQTPTAEASYNLYGTGARTPTGKVSYDGGMPSIPHAVY